MSSVNKVFLLGRVGQDPEIRYMPNGNAVANLSLATSTNYKDKESGERKENTEWHRLVAYGRTAEVIGEYVKKGAQLHIEGRLHYGRYEKDGQTRYTTDIIIEQMAMVGKREGSGEGQERPQQRPQQQRQQKPASTGGSGFDDMDDDIPF